MNSLSSNLVSILADSGLCHAKSGCDLLLFQPVLFDKFASYHCPKCWDYGLGGYLAGDYQIAAIVFWLAAYLNMTYVILLWGVKFRFFQEKLWDPTFRCLNV